MNDTVGTHTNRTLDEKVSVLKDVDYYAQKRGFEQNPANRNQLEKHFERDHGLTRYSVKRFKRDVEKRQGQPEGKQEDSGSRCPGAGKRKPEDLVITPLVNSFFLFLVHHYRGEPHEGHKHEDTIFKHFQVKENGKLTENGMLETKAMLLPLTVLMMVEHLQGTDQYDNQTIQAQCTLPVVDRPYAKKNMQSFLHFFINSNSSFCSALGLTKRSGLLTLWLRHP